MKSLIYIFLCFLFISSYAQERTISGKITDENGKPIAGATATIEETGATATTDANGFYSLTVPDDDKIYSVVFSFTDYVPKQMFSTKASIDKIVTDNVIDVKLSSDLLSLSLEELLDVMVVSASKVAQKQSDAPNIINTVTKDQIDRYGWESINDVLYYQPGFAPSQDYERRTLGFRGLWEGWNNSHLLMLIDGIPFNDNLYGSAYTWEITPLVFTKNMEIIRGPGGALYGSNALNGVVTINTRDAKKFKNIGSASVRMGSLNTQIYDFTIGNEGKNFGIITAFNAHRTDGVDYKSRHNALIEYDPTDTEKHSIKDQRTSNYIFAKIYGRKALEGLSFQYHEQNWSFESAYGWLFNIPDLPESLKEFRRILALRYAPRDSDKAFNYEITTKYQIHGMDWNLRYYPKGAYPEYFPTSEITSLYPNGITEYVKTDAEDFFLRVQFDYNLNKHIIIGGIETDVFYYDGDHAHYTNADLNDEGGILLPDGTITAAGDAWYAPYPNGENREAGPLFEYALYKPVTNIGIFGQYMSPKFGDKLQITLSGRYDSQSFNYIDINDGDKEKSKSYSMLTPRGAIVFSATDKLTFKIIGGKAFRTPSPTEIFGSNTWALASNINELEPETVTNYDFGAEFDIMDGLKLKANGFMYNFENIIVYSAENYNLSTNIYTIKNAGAELEVNYKSKNIDGFFNLTYTSRLDEEIKDVNINDTTIVTWAPPMTFNLGFSYHTDKFYASLLLHNQGEVARRNSDDIDGLIDYRPEKLDSWMNIDMKVSYKVTNSAAISVIGKNLLDSEQFLAKNNAYPFDYRREMRRISVELLVDF